METFFGVKSKYKAGAECFKVSYHENMRGGITYDSVTYIDARGAKWTVQISSPQEYKSGSSNFRYESLPFLYLSFIYSMVT